MLISAAAVQQSQQHTSCNTHKDHTRTSKTSAGRTVACPANISVVPREQQQDISLLQDPLYYLCWQRTLQLQGNPAPTHCGGPAVPRLVLPSCRIAGRKSATLCLVAGAIWSRCKR